MRLGKLLMMIALFCTYELLLGSSPFIKMARMMRQTIICGLVQGVWVTFFELWELITQKWCTFDQMLDKPKCVWEAYIYFDFSAICLQFSKQMYASQTHFDFTNMGSKVHFFWVMSSQRSKNETWTPCIKVWRRFVLWSSTW